MRWALRSVMAIALLGACGVAWLVFTESGLRWALGFAPPELAIAEPRGALARTISFERISFQGSEAREVSFELNLLALATDTISIRFLRADSVVLKRPASSGHESGLPFRIRVDDAHIRSVVFEGYEIHDLGFDYAGDANRHELQAAFSAAGARARAKATIAKDFAIEAELQGLNLAVFDPELPQTALQATISGRGSRAEFKGSVVVRNGQPKPIDHGGLPFASAEADFSTDLATLSLAGIKAALHPAGTLQGKGSASAERASFALRLTGVNLRGLYSSLRTTRLSGELELELASERQRVKGRLAQDDLSLAADAERSGDGIAVRALHARAGDSEAVGNGRVVLAKPVRFAADLKLARFDPSRFGDYPAGSIDGALIVDGNLAGAGRARWELAGMLLGERLASKGSAKLAGERVSGADAWLSLGANRASAHGSFGGPRDKLEWTLHVPDVGALASGLGGDLRARGTASGTWKQPSATVHAEGSTLRLSQFVLRRASVEASGTLERHEGHVRAQSDHLDLKAHLRGGWRAGAWRGEIASAENAGDYPVKLKRPTALEANARRVVLGRFEADVAGAQATVEALRWEGRRLTSRGSIGALPAQWILAALGVQGITGDLLLEGDWDVAATPELNGKLALRRARGDLAFAGTLLELTSASLQAQFVDDRTTASAQLASRLGNLQAEGSAAGFAPDSALAFTAELEAAELRSLTEPLWTQARVSGQVAATLRGAGTLARPELSGTLRGDALGFDMPPWGIALRDGRVRAELDANRLRLTEALIAGAEGTLRATGTLPLASDDPVSVDWEASNFRLLARPDRRLVVSGKGGARFDGKRFALSGQLRADSGQFDLADDALPQLEDDVEVAGAEKAAPRRGTLPLDLELDLDLGKRLTLRAYGYDGGITGRLKLTTSPAGQLIAHGRVEAVRARFYAYGQQLEVDPGVLVYDGPLDAPGLDITAWRRRQQVEAGIHLTGTLQRPHVELVSNPPVNESEKLSWLVLGRAPTEAGAADLAVLQAAGGAVFGRGGQPPLSRRLATRLGFDDITVRSSSDLASSVVGVGKRYTEELYVGFEQALGTTAEYLVKLDYALTQRISLRGQTGTTTGIGFFYRYSWD